VGRRLDEVYCERIREAGSHWTWEPNTWVWPGDYGSFRRGVFSGTGSLKTLGFTYRVLRGAPGTENIKTDGIEEAKTSVGAAVSDPLEFVLSGKGEVSYTVGSGDEVLLLTQRGNWYEIEDIDQLLDQVRAKIEDWPLSWAVICRVYQTSGGLVCVSSRSTSGFTIGLDASGMPLIGVTTRAGGTFRRSAAHAARRAFTLSPDEPVQDKAGSGGAHRRTMYTPIFSKGFRVNKSWWKPFGRPELLTLDGDPASGRNARSDPVDLVYDSSRATIQLDEIRSMSVHDLFEEVTPELLTEEVSGEISLELLDEEIQQDLTPAILTELGVETLQSVAVGRADVSRIREMKQRSSDALEQLER
jgi:hypothetical protein